MGFKPQKDKYAGNKLFILDESVVKHLINYKVSETFLSPVDKEIYVLAALSWYENLGFIPAFADREDCYTVWVRDSKPYWRSKLYRRLIPPNLPEKYNSYKGNRDKNRKPMDKSLEVFSQDLHAVLYEPEYEADDCAAAIAKNWMNTEDSSIQSCWFCTVDSDWQGFISTDAHYWVDLRGYDPRIRQRYQIFHWMKKSMERQSKRAKQLYYLPHYEKFNPAQIWNWKAAVGDSSDNLPPGTHISMIDLYHPPEEYDLSKNEDFRDRCRKAIGKNVRLPMDAKSAQDIFDDLGMPLPSLPIVLSNHEVVV